MRVYTRMYFLKRDEQSHLWMVFIYLNTGVQCHFKHPTLQSTVLEGAGFPFMSCAISSSGT